MAGCAALGCTNSSAKGYLMKRYPKDPIRKHEWAIRTKRSNWYPTDRSYLCEVHFEPHMWEKTRVDGSRKLRTNAVPTIFPSSTVKSSKRKLKGPTKKNIPFDISSIFIKDEPSDDIMFDVPEYVVINSIPSSALKIIMESEHGADQVIETAGSHIVSVRNIRLDHPYCKIEKSCTT